MFTGTKPADMSRHRLVVVLWHTYTIGVNTSDLDSNIMLTVTLESGVLLVLCCLRERRRRMNMI